MEHADEGFEYVLRRLGLWDAAGEARGSHANPSQRGARYDVLFPASTRKSMEWLYKDDFLAFGMSPDIACV